MSDRNSRESGSFFIFAISLCRPMKILSRPFGCLLLALFAMTFFVSCPKQSSPTPKAWIYLKGHKISFRNKFKVLDKRYDFGVCPDCFDVDMRTGAYFSMMDGHPDIDAVESCTLWIVYDEGTQKILSISVSYLFLRKINQKDLKRLSKEIYFDKFKNVTKPFSKTIGGVHYSMEVNNGTYGCSPSVDYRIQWLDN